MKFDWQDTISVARFPLAIFSAFGFYYYNYQNVLLGPLRDIADQHFAFNALRDLSVFLLGSYVGALVLIGLTKALTKSPEKFAIILYYSVKPKSDPKVAYKLLLRNRKIFANIAISIVSLILLYLNFTSSAYYLFQLLFGTFMAVGLSISLGTAFFGGRQPYAHRFIASSNGLVFFCNVFALLMICFVSINLSIGRVERIKISNPVEITDGQQSKLGYLVGATANGVFFLNGQKGSSVTFLPNSKIGRVVGLDSLP